MSLAVDVAAVTGEARRASTWGSAARGAGAGIVGGIAFGAAMIELDSLEGIAAIVRADTAGAGAVVHIAVSALVGAVFGLLVSRQRRTAPDALLWGIAYGAFFWFVGPLTLRPILVGDSVSWDISAAHQHLASLIGHVVWGTVTGGTWAMLGGDRARTLERNVAVGAPATRQRPRHVRMIVLGATAGLAAVTFLTALLPARQRLTAPIAGDGATNWIAVLAVGVVAGALYAALVPYSTSPRSPRLGARLVQGMAIGYAAWILVALTIVPLDQIDELSWTSTAMRQRFEVFPGYMLFGTLTALLYSSIAAGAHFLFSDELRPRDRVTAGPQRARATIRGAFAGLVGGAVFTIVMVQVGALGRVSELVGARSPVVGFFVHMAIATMIGIIYAMLFRRTSFDVRSAIGWGLAYGLLWWLLGALTLLPVLLGGDPQWSADDAARAFPSLVGHLIYGIALGVVFYLLEARHNPWWVTRTEAEAHRTRERREQVLTSAPALWAFVVFLTTFVAIVLASSPTR